METMKRTIYIALLFLVFVTASCAKHCTEGTLYRDCTGTYLKLDNDYYSIINRAKVESIEDNQSIRVTFEPADGPGPDIVCMMVTVPNAGYIKILSVKE